MNNTEERKKDGETHEIEPKPPIYKNFVDYVLNVPIETDEELANLGHIYTD